MKTLSPSAIAVLDAMTITDHSATITTGQLDRKLYLEVNAALESLGGKWNRKAKAHVFDGDPRDAIEQVAIDGCWHSVKQDFDFFETPAELAQHLVVQSKPTPGMFALEPSAGGGRIAEALRTAGCEPVCVEAQSSLAHELLHRGFDVACADFLIFDRGVTFDRIVMNPPFSKSQDVHHVMHAWRMLAPGGTLVSVMAAGVTFRQTRLYADFRAFAATHGHIEPLPERSFHESGTDVNTVLVILDRP